MWDSILALDKRLFLTLNFDGGPFWDEFFWQVSGKVVWIPLYLFFLWMIARRIGWKNMLLAAVCIGLAVILVDQVCNFFKDYLPKLRPTHDPDTSGIISLVKGYRGGKYGTVSAHAATSFTILTASSIFVKRKWFTALAVCWGLLVCYSRIYIGAHFPLDILFGILFGVFFGWTAVKLYEFAKIQALIFKVARQKIKSDREEKRRESEDK